MYRSIGWGVGVVKKGLSFWLTVSNIRLKQDSGLVGAWIIGGLRVLQYSFDLRSFEAGG